MAESSGEQLGEPCGPSRATPLHVVATLAEGLCSRHPIMLDALLAWVVAHEERRVAPVRGAPTARIEIPIMREPGGRFHLCSEAFGEPVARELRHLHKRSPWHEMGGLGSSKIARVDIGAGINKNLRLPYELRHYPQLEWWCIGDAERIREMLSKAHYLGDGRGRGHGRLDLAGEPWRVEACEPWPGFPLVRDGLPLRPLPPDWPGLEDPPLGYRTISFPYYAHHSAELCAVPGHH